MVRVSIYLTKIGKVILGLVFYHCFHLDLCDPLLIFLSMLFLKRMNIQKKSEKWPNANTHEQIDFECVEEELCLVVSQ